MQSVPSALATGTHIRAIDGLRGVAILLVLLHHFGLFQPGWAGVDVFFVISGFLITRILLWTKDSPHYFSYFYARRALRILPLYYSAIAFFFLAIFPIAARNGSPHYGMNDFLWYLFHLSNWWIGSGHMPSSPIVHFWSLAIEEQFYLVWPFLVFVLSRKNLARATIAIVVLSFSCRAIAATLYPQETGFIYFYTPFRIEPIAIGSLAAIAAGNNVLWYKLVSWRPKLFWIGFVVWTATILLGDNRITCVFGISAIAAVALSLLIQASNGKSPFDTSFFRHLGKYSYALYVIHYPVYLLARHVFQSWGRVWDPVLTAAIGVPVSYLLARASWVLIESRFLKLKNRFEYRLGSPLQDAPAEFAANSIPVKY